MSQLTPRVISCRFLWIFSIVFSPINRSSPWTQWRRPNCKFRFFHDSSYAPPCLGVVKMIVPVSLFVRVFKCVSLLRVVRSRRSVWQSMVADSSIVSRTLSTTAENTLRTEWPLRPAWLPASMHSNKWSLTVKAMTPAVCRSIYLSSLTPAPTSPKKRLFSALMI